MTETIKPALTAEQWSSGCGYWREKLSIEPHTDGKGFSIYLLDEGPVLEEDGEAVMASDASVRCTPEDRHALAALALHGQPFGFAWADVDALETAAARTVEYSDADAGLVMEVAARIAALLPPQEP